MRASSVVATASTPVDARGRRTIGARWRGARLRAHGRTTDDARWTTGGWTDDGRGGLGRGVGDRWAARGRGWTTRAEMKTREGTTRDDDAADDARAATETEETENAARAVKRDDAVTPDRGLGQRRALSAETRSRPFVPLKGEVLHVAWYREYDDTGKFTREEGLAYRECIEKLMSHYTMPVEEVRETLDGIERGWSDVTLSLGEGFNLRMQRHNEFETLTLNGPGNMKEALDSPMPEWQRLLPREWTCEIPGKVFLINHAVFRQLSSAPKSEVPTLKESSSIRRAFGTFEYFAPRIKSTYEDEDEDSLLEWDSGTLIGCGIGDGSRLFVNYELDDFGAMKTLVVVPPGESVFIRAGRQLQRFLQLEQYRLLLLQRLPSAKSRFPLVARLNERYEALASQLRRSKATARGHKTQQEFVTQITELEQAVTQLLTRTQLTALTTQAYTDIINLRLAEARFTRLGYEIRFLPTFVKKRIDPAVNTIKTVAEQARILSDALERTTALVQASVEVRLQRINERIAQYGLLFTVASVCVSLLAGIQPNGSLHGLFVLFKAKFFALVGFCSQLLASAP